MTRATPLATLLFAALLACGGSSGSPTGPVGPDAAPDVPGAPAGAELAATEERIAASEVGAAALAVDLEADQRRAISEAIARARAALADLRARWRAGEITAEEAVAGARAIRAALDAEIEAILTPAQRAEIESRRAAFRPGLELTDAQRVAIRTILDRWHALVLETLRAVRLGDLTFAEATRALADGAEQARDAVCGVLEPDQLALFPRCPAPAGD